MAIGTVRVSKELIADLLHLPKSVRCVALSVDEFEGTVVLYLDGLPGDGLPGPGTGSVGRCEAMQHMAPVKDAKGDAASGVWARSCWIATQAPEYRQLTERREWIEADIETIAQTMKGRG